MKNTVQEQWAQFVREVMPANAGETQRQEMKRAFYGGGWALFNLITRVGDELDEDSACAVMDGLHQEFLAFRDAVGTPNEARA